MTQMELLEIKNIYLESERSMCNVVKKLHTIRKEIGLLGDIEIKNLQNEFLRGKDG